MEFDFDQWQSLARDDPEQFERSRQALIESVITEAPLEHQPRLRALQCRIDLERRRSKPPLGVAVRLNSMMWERALELREALLTLAGRQEHIPESALRPAAQIFAFPKPD